MNSMELQDAILRAVDTLAQNRIDKIKADKTITCSISKCTNALTGEYKVSYNGGFIYAYSSGDVTYKKDAEVYVLVPEGDFSNQKMIIGTTSSGLGLQEDSNQSAVSAALSDYNLIGGSVVKDPKNMQPVGLNSYRVEDYELLYQYSGTQELNPSLAIDVDGLNNALKEAEAVMLRASFQTRLPKAHRYSMTGEYGLTFTLAFADRDNIDEKGNPSIKYYSYSLDSSTMSGNPFRYSNKSSNYQIFSIDTENFLYIDSILFYSKGFETKEDFITIDSWGDDIFVSNIQFYGLRTIAATDGEYTLSLSQPDGVTFKDIKADSSLLIKATVKKSGVDISDSTTFYWFKADGRVTFNSDDYQAYGGAGYAYLREKSQYGRNIYVYGNENKAYENKYLIVAVYKETIVLKDTFIIYNDSCKRDLSIESSLGVKFSFDRGTPTLTCFVDGASKNFDPTEGPAHKEDSWFRFVWSKVEADGTVTFFNQSYAEVKEEYDKALNPDEKKGETVPSYSEVAALRSLMISLEGVKWEKNCLTYPVKKVDTSATFKCGVFLRDGEDEDEYSIGEATITLQNESIASPTDYYIVIENGDQVFQYSESGVAPNSDRYTDPLEIKNLICHFYDPAGLEVNSKTYEVKWLVPLTDTMIVTPTESMVVNPATEKIEWYTQENYRLIINSDYNSFALNNQVQAIVTYQGQTYTQYTSFLFTKIGENGTNGTDIVAKISANNLGDGSYLPYIDVQPPVTDESGKTVYPTSWTDGNGHTAKTSEKFLSFNLYQRGSKLGVENDKVTWKIAGGTNNTRSKYLSVNGGAVSWSEWDKTYGEATRNQVVRGSIKYEGADYYAFYPVPVIERNSASATYPVRIPSSTTLKTILYNADGSNPIYNKNQYISIELDEPKYVVWRAGADFELADFEPANFELIEEKNSANGTDKITDSMMDKSIKEDESGTTIQITTPRTESKVYILPNDKYMGGGTNNIVHAAVYANEAAFSNQVEPELNIYVPLFLSLNTYGLSSLNAWDGNSVEINEDENYILAPQIGAGEKDSENKFTGIVMGKAEYYDKNDASGRSETSESIGLLGYSKGRQSIFLNAEDGSATFGLPESEYNEEGKYTTYNYTQGRIKLVPNGTSSIGSWKIGSRSLYNITPETEVLNGKVLGAEINNEGYEDLGKEYVTSIPSVSEGILMSANPSYLSIKGRMLKDIGTSYSYDEENTPRGTQDADFLSPGATIQPNDSFELQLDPNNISIFTMYRHTAGIQSPKDFSVQKVEIEEGKFEYRICNGGDIPDIENPYAIGIINGNNVIGWKHTYKTNSEEKRCKQYNDNYIIARQLMNEGAKPSGTWYFCVMDEPGPYYLPEQYENLTEKLKAENKKSDLNKKLFDNFIWRREAKVGIDNNGRFYTNALKDSTTSLTIGELGAYGKSASAKAYLGAEFEVGEGNNSIPLVKFFTDESSTNNKRTSTLYISGSSDVTNEYQRPLVGAFKDISLYAADSVYNSAEKETDIKLYLGRKEKENVKDNTGTGKTSIYPYAYLGGFDSTNEARKAFLSLSGYYEETNQGNKGEKSTLWSESGLVIKTPDKDSCPLDISTGYLDLDINKSQNNAGSGQLTLDAEKARISFSNDKVVLRFNNPSNPNNSDDKDDTKTLSMESYYGPATNNCDSISTWFGKDGISFKYNTALNEKNTNHLALTFDTVNGSSLTTDKPVEINVSSHDGEAIVINSNPVFPEKPGEAVGGGIFLTVTGSTMEGEGENKHWANDKTKDYTYLKLSGGNQQTSDFYLNSPNGSIYTSSKINIPGDTSDSGINMGTRVSVTGEKGTGILYADKLYIKEDTIDYNTWNSGSTAWDSLTLKALEGKGWNGKGSGESLAAQLSYIYASLQKLWEKIVAEEQTRSSAITDIWGQIGEMWEAINGKASSGHTHDYVPIDTYNSHKHSFASTVTVETYSWNALDGLTKKTTFQNVKGKTDKPSTE